MVGILAVALIVSQTPWFRDWLRRYVVRESKQYLNGELAIGGLGGNLLFGVNLTDIAIDVSGERILSVKTVDLDYNVFRLMSKGLVFDEITLHQPFVHVERDAQGWNLGRLVKKQQKEADREGPGRPISLPLIAITDGTVSIEDNVQGSYTLPRRIDDLDLKGSYEYAPVHYSIVVDNLHFQATSPQLSLEQLSGKLALRDDNLYLENVALKTAETNLAIEGVIENYLATPVVKLTTTGNVSLPEIARVVPAAGGYNLHPAINLKANGPAERLALDLDVRSEAGNAKGQVTADVKAPNFAVRGGLDVERLNLAPILKDPAQRSDITGHAEVDLRLASAPADAPAADRMAGTFKFNGPRVVAAGYQASDVRVTGSIAGPRITLDGRAAAYGGTATARGFIVTPAPGRQLAFDLQGQADSVDLRDLPASTGAPNLATDLSVAEYHVTGSGRNISGTARLRPSTVEGAKVADGTLAEFSVAPDRITYSARGSVADLDLQRIGRGLEVAALAKPEYESRINGRFDVTGSMPRTTNRAARGRSRASEPSALATMKLDASGTFTDSELFGGRLPGLDFEAHIDQGALRGRATGEFEGFNPARLTGRKDLDGRVTGRVDANVAVADLTAPITPDAVTADGSLTLASSTVGGLKVDSAEVQGRYAAQVGDLTRFTVAGPDVKVDASGRLALDRTSQSNLKYHVEAVNLTALARLAGQEGVGGTAILDGTLTGNAASLSTTGTLDGSNLSYEKNNALDLNSRYTVTVPELAFDKAQVNATTEATFLAVGGMQLNSLTATTAYVDKKIDFSTNIKEKTRELDASGQLILHPDHQEVHLPNLAVRTQGVEWKTAPGAEATIKYGANRIEMIDVRLVSGDQQLDVNGLLALGSETAAGETPATGAIKVNARNVDLQQLETLLLQNRGFTGKLSADATISGSTADPAIDGHVEIRDGGFQNYRYQSLVADVDYTAKRIGIDATLQQSPTESITAKGTVPASLFSASPGGNHVAPGAGDQVDLRITSTAMNLAIIQGVTTYVTNVAGTLQADVHVTGSGQDPHLDGYIDIKGGAFGVPLGGVSYTGLDTRIELDPDRIRLQKFSILDEHGEPLTVSGELAVHERQLGAVNINLQSDNFELIDNELGDVGVDTQLKITGELRRPKIVGDVRIEAGRLEVDRILNFFYDPYAVEALPEVVSAERTVEGSGSAEEATREALARAEQSAAAPGAKAAEEAPPAPGGLMEAVELDVRLRIPDNLVLRGNDLRPGGPTGTALGDLNITVGGDVQARKQAGGKVTLTGTVNTVRGTYEFQGRRFDLVRGGTLRFTGSSEINPNLDITATRLIPNTGVEARVRITGTPKAPELQLSSNPPLEESDILALIVFNRPVNELGTGERSSLAATAGGIATGFIAAPLGESIGKALDLDLFEITTTTEEGDLGAGVTLGQQIGDRAFLKLRQQFGQRNLTEFIIEYQLYDFLRLQVTAAPTSETGNRLSQRRVERGGADLIFFFSY
jgi:autotransporter translocation and assembly factor TamB